MLNTGNIIRKLWDAQGYGNLAVWRDGTTVVVTPGEDAKRDDGTPPLAILKPIPLVGQYPMLDNALGDPELMEAVEKNIRDAGGEISRD